MSEQHRIFVYGTLMKGEHHHDHVAGSTFVGTGETKPEYDLVQLDYFPAMLPGGGGKVIGEIYEVDSATLKQLDELEEVPFYFVRESIVLADGSEAQTYLMPRDRAEGAEPIPSGYFRMRTAPPKRR